MRQLTLEDLIENPQTFMVSASWCAPCRSIKKTFQNFDFPYINYDEEDEHDITVFMLKNGLNVQSFPTIVEYKDNYSVETKLPAVIYIAQKKRDSEYIEYKEHGK